MRCERQCYRYLDTDAIEWVVDRDRDRDRDDVGRIRSAAMPQSVGQVVATFRKEYAKTPKKLKVRTTQQKEEGKDEARCVGVVDG